MPFYKWKSSYGKGWKYNSNWVKSFLWLKKASDGSQDLYVASNATLLHTYTKAQ